MRSFLTLRPPVLLVGFLALVLAPLHAQPDAQRAVQPGDFDGWRTIVAPVLSRDGQWLAYSYMPEKGDGQFMVRQLQTGRTFSEPAGATPPPPFPQPTSPDERRKPPTRVELRFTANSQFLLALTLPTEAEQKAARLAGDKITPPRGLTIVNLATGRAETIARVKSTQVPEQAGDWVAYLLAPPDSDAAKEHATDASEPKKHHGTPLVLRNLATGASRTFEHVTEFSLTRDGRLLLFVVAAPDPSQNGVYAVSTDSGGPPQPLMQGPGRYLPLVWNLPQTQLAFLSDHADTGTPAPRFAAYLWSRSEQMQPAMPAVASYTPGMAAGMTVSEFAAPEFSRDGKKLIVGVAPYPQPAPKLPADPADRVTADLWSWNDGFIQPRQAVLAEQERHRTYRGVLDIATRRYTQLADPDLPHVELSADGMHALGCDGTPYRRLRDYDGSYADVYTVNPTTGERLLVLKKLRGRSGDEGEPRITLSPDGRRGAYFSDREWRVLNLDSGQTIDLTSALPVAFYNEDDDHPAPPPAYGLAGWSADSRSLIVYDRYDLWLLFPDGRPARDLTKGYGRKHRLILRYNDIAWHDPEEPAKGINLEEPLTLHAEDEATRDTGFYRLDVADNRKPERLLWGHGEYRYVGRAADADVLMLTASRFDLYPDVQVTDDNFNKPRTVTDGAAQMKPFRWGSAELVDYQGPAGQPLQAVLLKPADFDPHRKYPLIVFTYERLSETVNRFYGLYAGSNISFPFYVSNGYLVLMPDIAYTTGHPGDSALKCVLAALDAVEAQGFVNPQGVGIQGSSWGGYQAAYIIAHTDRFHAAEAGAAVGNMTSAYGGIRRTSGQPRLFQYEKGQSRIGQPLSAALPLYLENSPLFQVTKVQTPLLMLHNDRDGAVPWEQSVELFLSLRRHDIPVWLFNYHDEGHGLTRLADRKDFSHRMWQFFDHFLRGAPAPDWLQNGIPYIHRDQEKVRYDHPWTTAPSP